MKRMKGSIRTGFTLIEVLVTVVVIGVLAAVVIPAVTAQVTAGDAARVETDLNDLRTGIENFDIAVRQFPGDVDDLVSRPGTSGSSTGADVDADPSGATLLGTTEWRGPYLETSLPSSVTSSTLPNFSGAAFTTGYAATVNNHFLLCKVLDTASACNAATPDYLVVELDNLTASQLGTLNSDIDGATETASSTSGKFRVSGTTSGLYFATPYK
jgi:prepilin-type N-terminal cleavage/methylation domain-containing protein